MVIFHEGNIQALTTCACLSYKVTDQSSSAISILAKINRSIVRYSPNTNQGICRSTLNPRSHLILAE